MKTNLKLLFLLFFISTIQAQNLSEKVYTFRHSDKVYNFQPYESASIKQSVERVSDTEVIVKVAFKQLKSIPKANYPVRNLPNDFQKYIRPSSHIESEHPKIAKIAAQIKKEANTNDLNELVKWVLHWNVNHLSYGFPNEIHSAVEACFRPYYPRVLFYFS